IVGRVGTPAGGEAKDCSAEGDKRDETGEAERGRGWGDLEMLHRNSEHDDEDDRQRNPGVALVAMHVAIAVDADKRGKYCNDEYATPGRYRPIAQGIDKVATDNHIDG